MACSVGAGWARGLTNDLVLELRLSQPQPGFTSRCHNQVKLRLGGRFSWLLLRGCSST